MKFYFTELKAYLNCYPFQDSVAQAQIKGQQASGILNPPMLSRHQTGVGHMQQPDVQNA